MSSNSETQTPDLQDILVQTIMNGLDPELPNDTTLDQEKELDALMNSIDGRTVTAEPENMENAGDMEKRVIEELRAAGLDKIADGMCIS